ncbi:MAG: LPXTG cell wall anchor domain-containing protein, partial [Acutalibacteraceae bacterium]|nr:LPXTG cell wall anchor domain-containing protein [Acutalibacteraceae bacterium]
DYIALVTVNDNTFYAAGKCAVKLIDTETGLIDTSNTDIFPEDIDTFVMTVKATGYEPFTFTLLRKAEITEPSETSEPSEISEGSQPDASTDESSPSESKTSDVSITPSNDAPKTADTTALGMIIAALTVSLGTLLLTIRKKKE